MESRSKSIVAEQAKTVVSPRILGVVAASCGVAAIATWAARTLLQGGPGWALTDAVLHAVFWILLAGAAVFSAGALGFWPGPSGQNASSWPCSGWAVGVLRCDRDRRPVLVRLHHGPHPVAAVAVPVVGLGRDSRLHCSGGLFSDRCVSHRATDPRRFSSRRSLTSWVTSSRYDAARLTLPEGFLAPPSSCAPSAITAAAMPVQSCSGERTDVCRDGWCSRVQGVRRRAHHRQDASRTAAAASSHQSSSIPGGSAQGPR